jgi:hypothetical protein
MNNNDASVTGKRAPPPWNKGKLIGPKPPLRQGHVWSIRTRLQLERRSQDLALFNLAIDSKSRGCDVVAVRVDDVAPNRTAGAFAQTAGAAGRYRGRMRSCERLPAAAA